MAEEEPKPFDDAEGIKCRLLGCWARKLAFAFQELDGQGWWPNEVTLHTPSTSETRYRINAQSLARMKDGAYFVNTGRGALVDTGALIAALRSRKRAE